MSAAPSARAGVLERLARARLSDPARAEREALDALARELAAPVRTLLGITERLLDASAGAGTEGVMRGVRRVHAAARLLLTLTDEVLDPERVAPGRYPGQWAAASGRLRNLLRPAAAAVAAYAQAVLEDPATAAHDALADALGEVRASALATVGLADDAVQLLDAAAAGAPAEGASAEVRTALARARGGGGGAPAEAAPAACSVLVVDDSQVNRDLLERLLRRLGHRVTMAEGGLQALALMRANRYDLVLLDIIMPDVDGFQTLQQMKVDRVLREVPVLMISALDEVESVSRCIEMGAEDYLTKPFDPVILKARIGAILEKNRLRGMVGSGAS